MGAQFARYAEDIRRRWWIVLLVAGFAVAAMVLNSSDSQPKYVGKALLVQSTPGRTPEQDATMAVGYALLFNEPVTIGRMREQAGVHDRVTLEAKTVAASPILTIEATADDPELAQTAAARVAAAFRRDINAVRRADYAEQIAAAERALKSAQAQREPDGGMSPMVPVVQARLDTLRADAADQLQELQLRAGVSTTDPEFAFQLGTAAAGGLFLGVLAALGLAAMSPRLVTTRDVARKTGVEPLVEVPPGGSIEANRLREDRLRMLTNVVSRLDTPKSAVIALTDCRGAHEAPELAVAIARLSALQGRRTVLVHADNGDWQGAGHPGFNEALADSSLVTGALVDGMVDALKILPAGTPVADRYALLGRDRIDAVLDELRMDAETVVLVAPSIVDSIEATAVCAAADATLLVVGRLSSRAGDVTAAAEALAEARAVLIGAVVVDGRHQRTGHPAATLVRQPDDATDTPVPRGWQP
ncbi:hypothetical protein [Mycolicibacterium sp.]|uniref:hypothetical protein n=1 Tax=Mycolicibacterium sp. TaxID=2320850 RepID=UPI003D1290DC